MTEGGGSVPSLVSAGDVRTHLRRYDVTDDEVAVAGRLVAGWLREDTGGDITIPLVDTDPLWSAAFELVVLAVTNPGSIASRTAGPTSTMWPVLARRDAIRKDVRQRVAQAATRPRGNFPPAPRYPDPAVPVGGFRGQGGWPSW
jgi:hypothetical protein